MSERYSALDRALTDDPLPVVQSLLSRIQMSLADIDNPCRILVHQNYAIALAAYIRQSEMRADTIRKMEATLRHADESITRHTEHDAE